MACTRLFGVIHGILEAYGEMMRVSVEVASLNKRVHAS